MTPEQETRGKAVMTAAHHDYEKGLNLHASFKLDDRATGEDLVQDTFIKTWSYLVRGGEIDVMKAFLYHVLNNLIIDQYRKRKTLSLDMLLEKGFDPSMGDAKRLFESLDAKTVFFMIKRLPRNYRKAIHMRYVQELSIKEISLITGQSRNAVSVQMHRGLKKLKDLYAD